MPTYEFRCPQGHDFEKFFRSISQAHNEFPCPECGAVSVRRMSAGAGLLFKGSGFYLTDYGKNAHQRSGNGTPPAKAESGGADTGGAAAGGAAAKPADSKPSTDAKPSTGSSTPPKSGGSE